MRISQLLPFTFLGSLVASKTLPSSVITDIKNLNQLTPGANHPQKVWEVEIDLTITPEMNAVSGDEFTVQFPQNTWMIFYQTDGAQGSHIFSVNAKDSTQAVATCIAGDAEQGSRFVGLSCTLNENIALFTQGASASMSVQFIFHVDTFDGGDSYANNLQAGINSIEFGPGFTLDAEFVAGSLGDAEMEFNNTASGFAYKPFAATGKYRSVYVGQDCPANNIESAEMAVEYTNEDYAPSGILSGSSCGNFRIGMASKFNDFMMPLDFSDTAVDLDCISGIFAFSGGSLPAGFRYVFTTFDFGPTHDFVIANEYGDMTQCLNADPSEILQSANVSMIFRTPQAEFLADPITTVTTTSGTASATYTTVVSMDEIPISVVVDVDPVPTTSVDIYTTKDWFGSFTTTSTLPFTPGATVISAAVLVPEGSDPTIATTLTGYGPSAGTFTVTTKIDGTEVTAVEFLEEFAATSTIVFTKGSSAFTTTIVPSVIEVSVETVVFDVPTQSIATTLTGYGPSAGTFTVTTEIDGTNVTAIEVVQLPSATTFSTVGTVPGTFTVTSTVDGVVYTGLEVVQPMNQTTTPAAQTFATTLSGYSTVAGTFTVTTEIDGTEVTAIEVVKPFSFVTTTVYSGEVTVTVTNCPTEANDSVATIVIQLPSTMQSMAIPQFSNGTATVTTDLEVSLTTTFCPESGVTGIESNSVTQSVAQSQTQANNGQNDNSNSVQSSGNTMESAQAISSNQIPQSGFPQITGTTMVTVSPTSESTSLVAATFVGKASNLSNQLSYLIGGIALMFVL